MNKILIIITALFLVLFGGFWIRANKLSSKVAKAVIQPVVIPTATPSPELDKKKLWTLIEEWRKTDGCKPGGCQPYIEDERLCTIAEDRVDDPGDDHNEFVRKIESNYYGFTTGYIFQENKTGGADETDMLKRWLNSPGHAATLRKPYKYSCVAVMGSTSATYYAVQIFSNF